MVRRDDPRSDEELLAATATDAEAFAAFYRRHLRPVLAYLLHRTGRRDLAADLAAETFAAALQSLPRYEARPGQARGWLFSIASNKLADSARRGAVADRSRRELGLPVRELTDEDLERAEELIDAERMAGDLEALLADLPAEQREALLARVVEERDYREIAAEWRCSEAVVRQRVSRGLTALRRRLGAVA
ncbi:MAG TPA: sigma-70 family RNA polymerase sigma factor [Solirubrobacteraceae bacterium]|nr:sigma-70 family RNA polymerase sigma factor [Solirubrobacteraceae bacterium]